MLFTRHGNCNQAEACNCSRACAFRFVSFSFRFSFVATYSGRYRVVASGRRLLSKSGQQLMTGTAFKYVIAPTNARVLPPCPLVFFSSLSLSLPFSLSLLRILLIEVSTAVDLLPSPAPRFRMRSATCRAHSALVDTNLADISNIVSVYIDPLRILKRINLKFV